MRSSRVRVAVGALTLVLLSSVSVLLASASLAAARVAAAPPKFDRKDPCTYPIRSVVRRAFDLPVTGTSRSGTTLCYLTLGDDPAVAPNGRLALTEEFPGTSTFASAEQQYEDKHAIESLSEFALDDVFIGQAAYLNATNRALTVLANPRFAFTVSWIPADDEQLTAQERTALDRVARNIVRRARR